VKVVLIGATGFVGSALLQELLDRGHTVTAVVRKPEKLPEHRNLGAASADVYVAASIAKAATDHDAIISAFSPGLEDPALYEHHVQGVHAIIDGAKQAQVPRLLMVGGAGSLEIAPGEQLVDSPHFPPEFKQTSLATREALHLLQRESDLDWTFLSPPMHLDPGERTGRYRIGGDALLTDTEGNSMISVRDYAVAMIDELEQPRHGQRRLSVAY